MPLPKWNRRSIFQKLLFLSILLVIFLIMLLTIGPFFVRSIVEKQTTDIYPSTGQDEEMRIERSIKFHADPYQPDAIFDAPLALKLIVPAEQREALLMKFRNNIKKKRGDEQRKPPGCENNSDASVTPIRGSSTPSAVATGSISTIFGSGTFESASTVGAESSVSTSAASGGVSGVTTVAEAKNSGITAADGVRSSGSTTGAGVASFAPAAASGAEVINTIVAEASGGSTHASDSTQADSSKGVTKAASVSMGNLRNSNASNSVAGTDNASASSAADESRAVEATTLALSRNANGRKSLECEDDTSKDTEGKESESFINGCNCEGEKDDESGDDEDWCKLDDICKCYCHTKPKAEH